MELAAGGFWESSCSIAIHASLSCDLVPPGGGGWLQLKYHWGHLWVQNQQHISVIPETYIPISWPDSEIQLEEYLGPDRDSPFTFSF